MAPAPTGTAACIARPRLRTPRIRQRACRIGLTEDDIRAVIHSFSA